MLLGNTFPINIYWSYLTFLSQATFLLWKMIYICKDIFKMVYNQVFFFELNLINVNLIEKIFLIMELFSSMSF